MDVMGLIDDDPCDVFLEPEIANKNRQAWKMSFARLEELLDSDNKYSGSSYRALFIVPYILL